MDEIDIIEMNEKLTAENAKLSESNTTFQSEIEKLTSANEGLGNQVKDLTSKFEAAQGDLESSKAEVQTLTEERDSLKATNESIAEENKTLKAKDYDFEKKVAAKVAELGISTSAPGGEHRSETNEGETISRDEFENLTQAQRKEFFKAGGKIAR